MGGRFIHILVAVVFTLTISPHHLTANSISEPALDGPATNPSADTAADASPNTFVTSRDIAERRQETLAPVEEELGKLQQLFDQLPDDGHKSESTIAIHLRSLQAEKAKILAASDASIAADIVGERLQTELAKRQHLQEEAAQAARNRETAENAERAQAEANRDQAEAEREHQLSVQEARAQRQQHLQELANTPISDSRTGLGDTAGIVVFIVLVCVVAVIFCVIFDESAKPRWHLETRPDGVKVWVRESEQWFWFIRF